MQIHGLQKLTLLDFPGRTACTVFTGGCNFRCPFCHNASLVLRPGEQPTIPEQEVLDFLATRTGRLDGVCVTGGEPLLQADLAEFLTRVRALGFQIKLDTNGSFPDRLRSLLEQGLVDYVAMDIKSSPAGYAAAVGLPAFDLTPIRESAELLRTCGVAHEFRTTAAKGLHTPEDLAQIGQWLQGEPRYFIQAFKDSGDLIGTGLAPFSREELEALAEAARPFLPSVSLRGVD